LLVAAGNCLAARRERAAGAVAAGVEGIGFAAGFLTAFKCCGWLEIATGCTLDRGALRSTLKRLTILTKVSACSLRLPEAVADSSTKAAFCCVTSLSCSTASLI